MDAEVAVASAGIYGAMAAIRLAELGHDARLFDPLGTLRAASPPVRLRKDYEQWLKRQLTSF